MELTTNSPEALGVDPARLQRAHDYGEHVGRKLGATGGGSLITRAGEIIDEHYWGRITEAEDSAEFNADTIVPLKSITKGFTAIALAMAIENGNLWLEDPVVKYVPEWKTGDAAGVTIRHLATHSSGLGEGDDRFYGALAQRGPDDQARDPFLRIALSQPLEFQPGTSEQYSNPGTLLLAEAIGRAVGVAVPDLIRDRVFEPLGLKRIGWDFDNDLLSEVAFCVGVERTRSATPEDREVRSEWAGLFGNARSLAVCGQMLLNRGQIGGLRLLAPLTVDLMTSSQAPNADRGVNRHRGLLWWLKAGPMSPEMGHIVPNGTFSHGGGAHSVLVVLPFLDMVAVMLRNRAGDPKGFVYERDYPIFMDLVAASVGEL